MGYDRYCTTDTLYIYISVFNALVIGNGPLAAVLLCLKWENLMCGKKDSMHTHIYYWCNHKSRGTS